MMGAPTRLGDGLVRPDRDITPGRPRAFHCTDCERDGDRVESRGDERPTPRAVRRWTSQASGQNVSGALCAAHSNLEHCRRFQRVRLANLDDRERLLALDERHEQRLRAVGQQCFCAKAIEYGRRCEEHDAKPLHPCASGCGRKLVDGVSRCWECQQKLAGQQRTEAAE